MLMKDPKKSLAILISSKMKKPDNIEESPKSENGGEDDKSIAYKTAGEEILKAVESKSAESLAEAVKSLVHMCMDDYESEEHDEPENEEPQES